MAMFMYRCVEVRMMPMPSHECALTLRSKNAAERQTSTAITWRGGNHVTRTPITWRGKPSHSAYYVLSMCALTVAFAKFFTMASAYLVGLG